MLGGRLVLVLAAAAAFVSDTHARLPSRRAAPRRSARALDDIPPPSADDYVDRFCRGMNAVCERSVVAPVRRAVAIRPTADAAPTTTIVERLLAPPELPGRSRPLWLVMAGSVPTALLWYGYYKYSVEEELFYDELTREGRATGCGGYGTLFPFVYCILLGGAGTLLDVPGSSALIEAGSVWILLGQVNLYRRVNEILSEDGSEPPLYAWWALLPPPLDVVVGVRQVHFLARHWARARGVEWEGDSVAERYFPFISAPRFTLREFARTPSMWFWFTRDQPDIDWPLLRDRE